MSEENFFKVVLICVELIVVITCVSILVNCSETKHNFNVSSTKTDTKHYNIKYKVSCPEGIEGSVYFNRLGDYGTQGLKLIEFTRKHYPPKIQTEFEYEFDVNCAFDIKLECYSRCENTSISVYINDDLVETRKVEGHAKIFWHID